MKWALRAQLGLSRVNVSPLFLSWHCFAWPCEQVIANIRGGGEYGPKWHQAALKEKRHKAYEDVEVGTHDRL